MKICKGQRNSHGIQTHADVHICYISFDHILLCLYHEGSDLHPTNKCLLCYSDLNSIQFEFDSNSICKCKSDPLSTLHVSPYCPDWLGGWGNRAIETSQSPMTVNCSGGASDDNEILFSLNNSTYCDPLQKSTAVVYSIII